MNRELAIHLVKCPEVEITFFLPQCSQKGNKEAHENSVRIVEATRRSGFDQLEWLCNPPANLEIDTTVGHGVKPVSIKYGLRTADHGLRTTDCGLGIKYGLGMKRGLENMDWV